MLIKEIFEPYKKQLGIAAAVILIVSLGGAAYSGAINWSPSQPPASMKISLIPSTPAPPPPPVEEVEPEPEPDTVAEEKRKADIIRAKEEEEEKKRKEKEEKDRKERDRKKKEEKKKEDERKRKEKEEKKRKEEEKKRKEAEEKARREAEAAAAEAAKQRALFQRRVDRIAADISARILGRIDDYFIKPPSVPGDSDIAVIIRVRLNIDGSFAGIPEVEKPSGFPELDEAATRAVLKSAPFPMPKEPFILNDEETLEQFLEHTIRISPEDII